jgi:hypothetical protein
MIKLNGYENEVIEVNKSIIRKYISGTGQSIKDFLDNYTHDDTEWIKKNLL